MQLIKWKISEASLFTAINLNFTSETRTREAEMGGQTSTGWRSPLQRSVCHYTVTPSNHMITPTEPAAAAHHSPLMMTRAGSGLLMMTRAGGVMKGCEVALAQRPRSCHHSVQPWRADLRSDLLWCHLQWLHVLKTLKHKQIWGRAWSQSEVFFCFSFFAHVSAVCYYDCGANYYTLTFQLIIW